MFKVRIENCKVLKDVIGMLDSFIGDALFIVNEQQVQVLAMDASRVAIFRMILKKKSFIKYELDEKTIIGIFFNDLNKIFTRIEPNSSVELSFDGLDNELHIIAKKKEVKRKRTFKLKTIDIEYSEADIDFTKVFGHEYISNLLFDSDNFYLFEDAVKDGMIYSEKLEMITTKENIRFLSHGQVGEMICELQPDELTDYTLGKCQSSFSLNYLSHIIKLKTVGNLIEIHLDSNYPLKIDFEIGGGNDIVILLGPLVDDGLDDFDDDIDMEE